MGGSGGFFYGYTEHNELRRLFSEAAVKTRNEAFESEVSDRLNDILIDYNDRDVDRTHSLLDQIRESLQEDLESNIELRFGGSIAKRTYIDGFSDVDCLVQLKNTELEEMSPREALAYFKDKLERRIGRSVKISVGDLAVTLEYSDGTKIQLLPAIKKGSGLVIPVPGKNSWSNIIRPEKFAQKLTDVNKDCEGKLVPTIKIVKAINQIAIAEERRLSGYHIESIAIEVFQSYQGDKTVKSMVEYFFSAAKDRVLSNIKDSTGQSVHVDDYLGAEGSMLRQTISRDLLNIALKLKQAELQTDASKWLEVVGEK